MLRIKNVWAVLILLLVVNSTGFAQTAKPLPVSKDVIKGKLPNGITYYIRKNIEPKNRAELRLVVNAGSILETDKQVGLAHFTEHMAFNGTKNFKKQELVDFLEKSGVNFGADLNAYTSFDETVYELQVPTDSMEVFKKAMQILEDWAHNVSFENSEIDKERGVVVEEWRLGRGADARLRDKYLPVILKGSQYAKRLPIGTKENLDTFNYQTLKSFYKDWYRPDLQAVVVVGDINVKEVEQMIKEKFGKIPKATNPKPRKKFGIPPTKETIVSVLTDPEQQYNIVQVFYKQQAIKEAKTDLEYKANIVRELFNDMMSTRLQEIAQKPEAPFLFGSSSYSSLLGDKDALVLVAVAKKGGDVEKSIETLLTENERVKQFGFVETELERAKKQVLNNIENLYNERDKTKSAQLVQELVRNYLDGEPIPGIEFEFELYKKFLPTISLKDVNGLIAKWIKPTDRAVVVLGPETEAANLPKEKDILALLDKKQQNIKAYEDKVVSGSIVPEEPKAGAVVSEKKYEEVGATVWTLSNGARVVLKPTTFKNDEILISGIANGGTSIYPDSIFLSAQNSVSATLLGGVGNLDVMSLQKELTGKNVFVVPSVTNYQQGFNGSSSVKDFETALQLIHAYFTAPRKDENMFMVLQQQLTVQLANKNKDPNSVFNDSVSYIMGGYHPRRKPLTMERMAEIDLDNAFAVYKDRFSNAGQFQFTFVGSFDSEKIKPLIEKYIASLPSTGKVDSWKDVGIRAPQGIVEKVIKKGKENKASVRIYYTGATTYSDEELTQLQQTCKALGIKLREQLREDQGGVYGVGVNGNINRIPSNSYSISIQFGCAPENVEKLVKIVYDEIAAMKLNGAPTVNVEKVIAEDTRSMENEVKENDYWKYNLEDKLFYGEDPKIILEDPKIVKKLTVERTKEIANKYFNDANRVKIILLPEDK